MARRPVVTYALAALVCAGFAAAAPAAVDRGSDAETGLRYWEWRHDGVSVRLAQLLPDQVRAFFLGRGFPRAAVERLAGACLFQTVFRNDGTRAVEYSLDDWTALRSGAGTSLLTRERWEQAWDAADGISDAARIALRWALLPTRQRFEPGDYNWGMSSYGFAPGARFDLALRVRIGMEPVTAVLRDVECAPDVDGGAR